MWPTEKLLSPHAQPATRQLPQSSAAGAAADDICSAETAAQQRQQSSKHERVREREVLSQVDYSLGKSFFFKCVAQPSATLHTALVH